MRWFERKTEKVGADGESGTTQRDVVGRADDSTSRTSRVVAALREFPWMVFLPAIALAAFLGAESAGDAHARFLEPIGLVAMLAFAVEAFRFQGWFTGRQVLGLLVAGTAFSWVACDIVNITNRQLGLVSLALFLMPVLALRAHARGGVQTWNYLTRLAIGGAVGTLAWAPVTSLLHLYSSQITCSDYRFSLGFWSMTAVTALPFVAVALVGALRGGEVSERRRKVARALSVPVALWAVVSMALFFGGGVVEMIPVVASGAAIVVAMAWFPDLRLERDRRSHGVLRLTPIASLLISASAFYYLLEVPNAWRDVSGDMAFLAIGSPLVMSAAFIAFLRSAPHRAARRFMQTVVVGLLVTSASLFVPAVWEFKSLHDDLEAVDLVEDGEVMHEGRNLQNLPYGAHVELRERAKRVLDGPGYLLLGHFTNTSLHGLPLEKQLLLLNLAPSRRMTVRSVWGESPIIGNHANAFYYVDGRPLPPNRLQMEVEGDFVAVTFAGKGYFFSVKQLREKLLSASSTYEVTLTLSDEERVLVLLDPSGRIAGRVLIQRIGFEDVIGHGWRMPTLIGNVFFEKR